MLDNTIKAVEDALLTLYLERPKARTVSEIRDECKLSATIIRKVVWHSPKISVTKTEVLVRSKDYPGHVHQTRLVDAFQPTRVWLVEVIKTAERAETWRKNSTGRGFGG